MHCSFIHLKKGVNYHYKKFIRFWNHAECIRLQLKKDENVQLDFKNAFWRVISTMSQHSPPY